MKSTAIKRGSSILRPRARIVRTIGRDLISNEVIALVELIKNSYDADANNVRIIFEEPLEPAKGGILIEDDGLGMSLKVIREAWFEPATISKTRTTTTQLGRRVTGEKGIGRFAAARIAQAMEVESHARDTNRLVCVRFDWGRFDDEAMYLDEIKFNWEERQIPKNQKHGTVLHLTELNDYWEREKFERLRSELSRLVSPKKDINDFIISLELPEKFQDLAGAITPPPILGKPHYRLSGSVDVRGQLNATYKGLGIEKPIHIKKEILFNGQSPVSGPFSFEFRVWDRDRVSLDPLADELNSTIRQLRQDLNSACGISIYRDEFRVLLPDNDWLRLDIRRVQNPTMRISNNQIVGSVYISADANKGLRDQSNREGIVSSPAFDDFIEALKEVLVEIEIKRDGYRRSQYPQKPAFGLFEAMDITPLREYIEKRYPDDVELKSFLIDRTKTFEHGVAEVQQVLARYRRLATLGQIIDVVLHEGRTPVATISNEVVLINRDIDRTGNGVLDLQNLLNRLSTITQQTDVISTLFRRIAPFSGRKRGRPMKIAIEDAISDACALFKKRVDDLRVDIDKPDGQTFITAEQAEMQMIFVNLLENALYWLEKTPMEQRKIIITVEQRQEELIILFSDNGPGVPDDIRDRIFDPYFSAKPDGVGLGLTITGETAAEYNGTLELISGGPLSGATFRITLRRGIGDRKND